jgi:hypothetical protein
MHIIIKTRFDKIIVHLRIKNAPFILQL